MRESRQPYLQVAADAFVACRHVSPAAAAAAARPADPPASSTEPSKPKKAAAVVALALVTPTEPHGEQEMCPLQLTASASAATGDDDDVDACAGDHEQLSFMFRRQRFRHLGGGAFAPPAYPDNKTFQWYLSRTGHGKPAHVAAAAEKWGANEFEFPMPTFGDLLKEQLLAPFFVFQVFCCALWCMDEYWYYSLFTLAMLVVFESTAGAFHLLTIVHFIKPHRSCFTLFTITNGSKQM